MECVRAPDPKWVVQRVGEYVPWAKCTSSRDFRQSYVFLAFWSSQADRDPNCICASGDDEPRPCSIDVIGQYCALQPRDYNWMRLIYDQRRGAAHLVSFPRHCGLRLSTQMMGAAFISTQMQSGNIQLPGEASRVTKPQAHTAARATTVAGRCYATCSVPAPSVPGPAGNRFWKN